MRTSVLRRQSKRIGKHPDLRAVAASSKRMNEVIESPPACNFPEILARDLEMSEATFLAKSMTAGAPIRSLATPMPEQQMQSPLYVGIQAQNPHVHWEDASSKECGLGVIDEASYHSNSSENGTPSEVASLTSDSGSDSGADMEPPSVSMRQQSVCTTATSVMAHCLPPKEQPRYSLVAFEESYQGQSWIDFDIADSEDDDEQPREAQTACPGSTTKHTSKNDVAVQSGHADTFSPSLGNEKPSDCQCNDSSSAQSLALDRALASLPLNSSSGERPRTSSGISSLDQPRKTDRSYDSHKRSSSSELTSRSLFEFQANYPHSVASASSTLASQGSKFDHEVLRSEAYPPITSLRQAKRHQARMAAPTHHEVSPPGRGIADEAEPTATDVIDECTRLERREVEPQVEADISATDSMVANKRMSKIEIPQQLYKEIVSGSAQPALDPLRMNPPEAPAQVPQEPPTTADLVESSDSSIDETFFRSKITLPVAGPMPRDSSLPLHSAKPTTTSPPTTRAAPVNMRLHPDVFSRLETSIAGFPDTMLSTKSLPIEIIRSLPKSRAYTPSSFSSLDMALEQPDSTHPPSSYSHKWKVSTLRRRDNNNPPPPSPLSHSPPSTSQPSPASIIQRIFPQGNTFHSDSLYAHLVAYLYISSLSGPDTFYNATDSSSMSPPTNPMRTTTASSRSLMHNLIPTNENPSITVPTKASSFLGMGTSTPTPSPDSTTGLKLSKMRSLLSFHGCGGKGGRTREEGQMIPAKPPSAGGGRSKPVTERDVREVQAGLLRCVRNLVAKLRAGDDSEEIGSLREDDFEIDSQGWRTLDPYLLRALCEVVRAEEERLGSGLA